MWHYVRESQEQTDTEVDSWHSGRVVFTDKGRSQCQCLKQQQPLLSPCCCSALHTYKPVQRSLSGILQKAQVSSADMVAEICVQLQPLRPGVVKNVPGHLLLSLLIISIVQLYFWCIPASTWRNKGLPSLTTRRDSAQNRLGHLGISNQNSRC